MKKILLLIVLLASASLVFGQTKAYIGQADSNYIQRNGGNAELIIQNATKDTLGFLYNKGNGRTEFRKGFRKINDSIFLIGTDTLKTSTGGIYSVFGRTGTILPEENDYAAYYVKISDTAAMLLPYLRKIDTLSLSNRINQRVKYTDTASMLFPYLRKALGVKYTDTTSMLAPYMLKGDSAKFFKYSDTAASFSQFVRIQDSLIFQYPIVRNGRYVNLDYHAPIYNSQFVQSIHQQPGTPMHGMTWVYDSTKVEWRHGFVTENGTVISGVDTLYFAGDSLKWEKGGVTYVEKIPTLSINNANAGTGFRWLLPATQEIKTLHVLNGIIADSTTNANALTLQVDSTMYSTVNYSLSLYDLLNSTKLNISDTSAMLVNYITNVDVYAANKLIQPGYVTWSGTGLTFDVTAAVYDIENVRYYSNAGQIALDAADATYPRIDVIAVDNTGSIVKITGTAEANPVQPQIDPSTQVLLTSILIPAGATEPEGLSDDFIYDENVEWTSAAIGLTANFDNTVNTYNGSKSVAISGFSNGQAVQWTNTEVLAASNQILTMQVRLSSNWNNSNNASIMLMRGNIPISQALLATNYGLVKTNSGGFQNVSIPITAFKPTDSFDRVRVSFLGNSGNTVNIDYVRLQTGAPNVVATPTVFTKAYNGLHNKTIDTIGLGGKLVKPTIIEVDDQFLSFSRKDSSGSSYQSAITSSGVSWLTKYSATKLTEIISMADGSYSGTYGRLTTTWGSNTTEFHTDGGRAWMSGGTAGGDLIIDSTGQVTMPQYGVGTYSGTATKYAAWDSNHRLIEVDAPSAGGGITQIEAYNGLTAVNTDSVKLGGGFVENTTINGNEYNFDLIQMGRFKAETAWFDNGNSTESQSGIQDNGQIVLWSGIRDQSTTTNIQRADVVVNNDGVSEAFFNTYVTEGSNYHNQIYLSPSSVYVMHDDLTVSWPANSFGTPTTKVLPISVNGNYADANGNITVSTGGGTSTHTVTLAMPSAFNVSGPAVNTGTITVTGAGTNTQVNAGDGTLVPNKGVAGQTFSGTTLVTTLVSGEVVTTTISAGGGSVNPRVETLTTSTTPTTNCDNYDMLVVSTLGAAATITAPSGTPSDGRKIVYRIRDSGTSKTLTWDSLLRFGADVVAPASTTAGKWMYIGIIYNSIDSVWDVVSVVDGF